MKKFITFLLTGIIILPSLLGGVYAQTDDVSNTIIHVFKRDDCTHCQDQKEFLDQLAQERTDFTVVEYDIYTQEGEEIWEQVVALENTSKVTPITIVGYDVIVGFSDPETTGEEIMRLLDRNSQVEPVSLEEFIQAGGTNGNVKIVASTCSDSGEPCQLPEEPLNVKLPFFGVVNVKQYSLPVLSVVLGFVDGFNPCAMWVLVTFLVVLMQIGDRRKMWLFAGLFILAETIMYHLILQVWFTTWDFVGLNNIVTPIVGIISLGAGIFFLYEWKTSDGTCKVTNVKQKQKIKTKINSLVSQKFTIFTAIGIIGLALSVNVIEFACSIGIPQAFTKVLELNNLTFWQTEFYMLLYILFYMVDDFIVFGLALYSFEKLGLTTKYSKISNLVGGILMIILGFLLLFFPEILSSL
ncbi:glutaredoxin [Candidatus Dojkabacteria bacterium]|uniref:Glutaredoxin n=1 Tax=Candidatus Dojkabacteria bacterium TaxID=2099670 RepID=A0A955RKA9_9BACT|nr:glutaredoxin [Candidatus Dojkabacteria bacterium]